MKHQYLDILWDQATKEFPNDEDYEKRHDFMHEKLIAHVNAVIVKGIKRGIDKAVDERKHEINREFLQTDARLTNRAFELKRREKALQKPEAMAMLYRGEESKEYSREWLDLRRYWVLPAIYRNQEKLRDEKAAENQNQAA